MRVSISNAAPFSPRTPNARHIFHLLDHLHPLIRVESIPGCADAFCLIHELLNLCPEPFHLILYGICWRKSTVGSCSLFLFYYTIPDSCWNANDLPLLFANRAV